jgi:gas vesicle protein
MSENKGTETALIAFLTGAVVAAGITLLLTPRTGREVREKLGEVTDGATQKLKECAREAKFKVRSREQKDNFNYDGGSCWI